MRSTYDVAVIGGGPAGLAAAVAAKESGADVLLVEREGQLGGILKQCVHDGFGQVRYGAAVTGPEYAARDVDRVRELGCEAALSTFVLDAGYAKGGTRLVLSNREGIHEVVARRLVLATGCRERTAKQVFIHGDRPSGVFTAGCAQNLVNVQGMMPGKRVVVLGSGDIGLIMARRLTLEGAEVIGVYEARPKPSGLALNVAQCLDDFGIPLHLGMTVTRTFGRDRLEAVEVCQVDATLRPLPGTEQVVPCDTLVLSVGLIPENELAERLGVPLCAQTRGPVVDQTLQTQVPGIYSAGNCLSVNDLVDYVSECGTRAGRSAAASLDREEPKETRLVQIEVGERLASCVPQRVDLGQDLGNVVLYLRSDGDYARCKLMVRSGGTIFANQRLRAVRQAESLRLEVDLTGLASNVQVLLVQEP